MVRKLREATRIERIEAHIFVAFIAYCLQVTLKQLLKQRAPGLTPRIVLEKLAAMQLLDVHFPTADGRELIFTRYTQPEPDQQLLLAQLGWGLPEQARPRISAKSHGRRVVQTFQIRSLNLLGFLAPTCPSSERPAWRI